MKYALIAAAAALSVAASVAQAQPLASDSETTTYHTVVVDGLNIFYREAGPTNAPTILLLHGYPSSSRMFATLMPLLASHYHLVAPDYPGFGESDAPVGSNPVVQTGGAADPVRRVFRLPNQRRSLPSLAGMVETT